MLTAGEPLGHAQAAIVMIHGRGADASSILMLANEFEPSGFAYLAPQAADNTWYPNRFLQDEIEFVRSLMAALTSSALR